MKPHGVAYDFVFSSSAAVGRRCRGSVFLSPWHGRKIVGAFFLSLWHGHEKNSRFLDGKSVGEIVWNGRNAYLAAETGIG